MQKSSPDETLRFVLLRPRHKRDEIPPLTVDLGDDFVTEMADTLAARKFDEVKVLADRMFDEDELVRDPSDLAHATAARNVADALADDAALSDDDVRRAVTNAFGRPIDELAKDGSVQRDFRRLSQTLLITKYAPRATEDAPSLAAEARVLGAIVRSPELQAEGGFDRVRAALTGGELVFPETLLYRRMTKAPVPVTDPNAPETEAEVESETPALRKAIDEVLNADRRGLVNVATERPTAKSAAARRAVPMALSAAGMRSLSTDTQALLRRHDLNPASLTTDALVGQLDHLALTSWVPLAGRGKRGKKGDTVLFSNGALIGVDWLDHFFDFEFVPPSVPTTHAEIRSVGVGELMVTRQHLKGYFGGEVAHIENVLRGEDRSRTHKETERSEIITGYETEITTEEENEISSTERYELQREIQKTIEEREKMEAGVEASFKYGDWVEIKGSFQWERERSEQEESRVATTYAKEITDRSLKKLVEKVKHEKTEKFLREVQEENKHGIDNKDGSGNISGVYQWVDKVYEAQVYNYGWRLMFDLMIPEPAAFVLHALTQKAGIELPDAPKPPEPFTLTPFDINRDSYLELAAMYGATDIEPPPDYYIWMAKHFDERAEDVDTEKLLFTKTDLLEIEDGYEAYYYEIQWTPSWLRDDFWFHVFIGTDKVEFTRDHLGHSRSGYLAMRGEASVGMNAGFIDAYTLTIQIKCVLTVEAYEKWRYQTFERIRAAYLDQVRDYEDKLALLRSEEGPVEIRGTNPEENRRVERTELKKHCISVLNEDRFLWFDAILEDVGTYPEIDFGEAQTEGAYIRFFEQAFEWEQMSYVLYPYFWGRKRHWVERFLTNETDPKFAEFLKAGACRVVLPVRLGFEDAVLHFLETGMVWNGSDELPEISSDLYLPIAQEIRERTGEEPSDTPFGNPWEVRVPTALVKLRDDDSLPRWEKNEVTGDWEPVDTGG